MRKPAKKKQQNADKILNISVRVNLGIPDGNIQRTKENLADDDKRNKKV